MNDLSTELHNVSLSDWAKDTWKKECLNSISIDYRKVLFSDNWKWSCRIRFNNGNTDSTQTIEKETLPELVREMELFFSTLK